LAPLNNKLGEELIRQSRALSNRYAIKLLQEALPSSISPDGPLARYFAIASISDSRAVTIVQTETKDEMTIRQNKEREEELSATLPRTLIEEKLTEIGKELELSASNPIFKSDGRITELERLKRLTNQCIPEDSDLIANFLSKKGSNNLHLGWFITADCSDEGLLSKKAFCLYLDILNSLKQKNVASKVLFNLFTEYSDKIDVTFLGRLCYKTNASSAPLDNSSTSLIEFIISLKSSEVTDDAILDLLGRARKDSADYAPIDMLASISKKDIISILNYLLTLLSEEPEANLNSTVEKIAALILRINRHGNHLGDTIAYHQTKDPECLELYLNLLFKLWEKKVISSLELLKVLTIPNESGVNLITITIARLTYNFAPFERMIEQLEKIKSEVPDSFIKSGFDKHGSAEDAPPWPSEYSTLSGCLIALKERQAEFTLRIIRDDFFSDSALKELAPLHEKVMDELIKQSRALSNDRDAINLLQEALPGSTSSNTPLARYFALACPAARSIFFKSEANILQAKINSEIAVRLTAAEKKAAIITGVRTTRSLN